MTERCAVYRHFDAEGALLYVGMTNNPKRREWEHSARASWWDRVSETTIGWFDSREEAAEAERLAIRTEGPAHNGRQPRTHEPTGNDFSDWLGETGIMQHDIAAAYGVSEATMSRIVNGKARASLHFACFVEDLSGGRVPVRYWLFGPTADLHGMSGPVSQPPGV